MQGKPIAELLLEYGANKDAQNADGNTPLHSAARWNRDSIATLLLEADADYKRQNRLNERPLDVAKEFGHEEVVTLLDDEAEQIDEPMEGSTMIFPHHSEEATAIRMMLERAAREEAIATQS